MFSFAEAFGTCFECLALLSSKRKSQSCLFSFALVDTTYFGLSPIFPWEDNFNKCFPRSRIEEVSRSRNASEQKNRRGESSERERERNMALPSQREKKLHRTGEHWTQGRPRNQVLLEQNFRRKIEKLWQRNRKELAWATRIRTKYARPSLRHQRVENWTVSDNWILDNKVEGTNN